MNGVHVLLRRVPIKWGAIGKKALRQEERRREDETRRQKVHRCYEYPLLQSMQDMNNSGRRRLEAFEGAFRYLFANSTIRLGKMQKEVIDVITIAFLRKMFADDLVGNLKYLCKKFLIDRLFDTLAITLPRRIGKTVSVAIMVAVIMVSQPAGNCVIYNLTSAQAEEFIAETTKYLNIFKDSPEFGWTEVKRDVRRHIFIKNRKFGGTNSIKSYACALKGDGKIDKTIYRHDFFLFPTLEDERESQYIYHIIFFLPLCKGSPVNSA